MSCGIFVWGMGTLAGSFMPNYWSFLLARIVVGVGEAMFSTVAATLISVNNTSFKPKVHRFDMGIKSGSLRG